MSSRRFLRHYANISQVDTSVIFWIKFLNNFRAISSFLYFNQRFYTVLPHFQKRIVLWKVSKHRSFDGLLKEIIITIGIQPLGRSGQRPEFSQATGMALVRCILGKFLGVACHCFPPLFRCSHFSPPGASTSATTWDIPAAEVGTVGENVVR